MSRTAADIIEIGRDLSAQKGALGHGNYLAWIEAEFSMSERTARRFVEVAGMVVGKSATVADLTPAVLYALAAASTEEPVRDEVLRRAEAGEKVKASDVADLKRKLAVEKATAKEARQDVRHQRAVAQEAKDERVRGAQSRCRGPSFCVGISP